MRESETCPKSNEVTMSNIGQLIYAYAYSGPLAYAYATDRFANNV